MTRRRGRACAAIRTATEEEDIAGPDTPVHAAGPEGVRRTFTLGELLPAAFGPDALDGGT